MLQPTHPHSVGLGAAFARPIFTQNERALDRFRFGFTLCTEIDHAAIVLAAGAAGGWRGGFSSDATRQQIAATPRTAEVEDASSEPVSVEAGGGFGFH